MLLRLSFFAVRNTLFKGYDDFCGCEFLNSQKLFWLTWNHMQYLMQISFQWACTLFILLLNIWRCYVNNIDDNIYYLFRQLISTHRCLSMARLVCLLHKRTEGLWVVYVMCGKSENIFGYFSVIWLLLELTSFAFSLLLRTEDITVPGLMIILHILLKKYLLLSPNVPKPIFTFCVRCAIPTAFWCNLCKSSLNANMLSSSMQ